MTRDNISLIDETVRYGSLLLACDKISTEEVIAYCKQTRNVSASLAIYLVDVKKSSPSVKLGIRSVFYRLLESMSPGLLFLRKIDVLSRWLTDEEIKLLYRCFIYYLGGYNALRQGEINFLIHTRRKDLLAPYCLLYEVCIQHDYLELLNPEEHKHLIKKRLKYLSVCAPLYLKEVALPYYKSKVNLSLFSSLELNQNLRISLSNLPLEIYNYVLGLSLREVGNLKFTLEEPLDDYVEKIKNRNMKLFPKFNQFGEELIYVNTENTLCQNVFSYSPEDIAYYINGKYCYFFTLPEFKTLIEKKKNFYTNEDIPTFFYWDISYRYVSFTLHILPFLSCAGKPIKEMLTVLS